MDGYRGGCRYQLVHIKILSVLLNVKPVPGNFPGTGFFIFLDIFSGL
jgi:hypothetical protein